MSVEAPKETSTTRRVNVTFSCGAYEVLEVLAARRRTSLSEVLRDAIALEKWFADTRREGGRILVERKNRQIDEIVRFR